MSWSQLLLAAAILVVFLLWRRARRQVADMRSDIEAHRARNTFTFEVDEHGPEFIIRDAAGGQIEPTSLQWTEHGLEMLEADRRLDAGAELMPGAALELVDVGGRVDVVMAASGAPVADVDGVAGAELAQRLDAGEIGGCVLLRQPRPEDRRVRVLLIHPAVDVEL